MAEVGSQFLSNNNELTKGCFLETHFPCFSNKTNSPSFCVFCIWLGFILGMPHMKS